MTIACGSARSKNTRGKPKQHETIREASKEGLVSSLHPSFMALISDLSSDLLSYMLGFVMVPVLPVASSASTRYDEALEVRYSLLCPCFVGDVTSSEPVFFLLVGTILSAGAPFALEKCFSCMPTLAPSMSSKNHLAQTRVTARGFPALFHVACGKLPEPLALRALQHSILVPVPQPGKAADRSGRCKDCPIDRFTSGYYRPYLVEQFC